MIVKCPKCDSENVAPIYYGIQPDNNEIRELIDNNKIIYGGSIMLDDQPHEDYGCQECGYRWSLDLLPGMYIKKIRFKVEDFGLGTIDMKRRYVYEIYPDGRWIEYTYQGESNRYTYKDICVTINIKSYLVHHYGKRILWKHKFATDMDIPCRLLIRMEEKE